MRDPRGVRDRFGHVIDYLARVELEVDRNVLELLTLLPDVSETDRLFYYADVWQPQEIQHGLILDRLQQDIDLSPADPNTDHVSPKIRILGSLAHFKPVQEVARLLYYLTGAATRRPPSWRTTSSSTGSTTWARTPSRAPSCSPSAAGAWALRLLPLSATEMFQQNVLTPWQVRLAKVLRRASFSPVGAHTPQHRAQFGGVLTTLGLDQKVEDFGAQIGLVEHELLWARDQGMRVPDYILAALRDTIEHSASTACRDGSPPPCEVGGTGQ